MVVPVTAWKTADSKPVTGWANADVKTATDWLPNYGEVTYDTLGKSYDDAEYTYDQTSGVRLTKLPTQWSAA